MGKKLDIQLINIISNIQGKMGTQDDWLWTTNDNEYTVRSGYKILNQEDLDESVGSLELIWNIKASPFAPLCIWRAMQNRLPTKFNLSKRSVDVGSPMCRLSLEGEETTKHLFIACKLTQRVWDASDRWVGIEADRHEHLDLHMLSFHLLRLNLKVNK